VVPANGNFESDEFDDAASLYVARLYDVATTEVDLVQRTVVARALPKFLGPLNLTRNQRRGDLVLAGDYLQTPSIQGALVSGRRAAHAVLSTLGV
jgi:predicted NAD/FAD-dependent oxidoreductase